MTSRGEAVGRWSILAGGALLLLFVTSMQLGAAPDPTIKFIGPKEGAKLADEATRIEVSYAGSAEHPIVLVEVFVDGKRQFEYRPPQGEPQGTRSFTWSLEQVAAGEHRLRAQAKDSAGRVASATVTVGVEAPAKGRPARPLLDQLRRRLQGVRPRIEALPPRDPAFAPYYFGQPAPYWNPTVPPTLRGRRRALIAPLYETEPDVGSRYWYPVDPARPIGKGRPTWGEIQIIPRGQGGEGAIIIPRERELLDVWPRVWPKPEGEYKYEFRLPDGRDGKGTIIIVPRDRKGTKKPEEHPKEPDEEKRKPPAEPPKPPD